MKNFTISLLAVFIVMITVFSPKNLFGQTATSWEEFGNGLPLPIIKDPGKLPPSSNGNATDKAILTYYTVRATFETDYPGLPLEDFEESPVPPGGVVGCGLTIDENTNDACFSTGDIIPGFVVGSVNDNIMVVLGSGVVGNASKIVGPNFFADELEIVFNPPVNAVGMDLVIPGPEVVDIEITHMDGVDNTTASASPTGSFWGIHSDATISKIIISSPSGSGELIDNISFESSAPDPSTISQTDADGDGNPDIFDPCSCGDPQNIYDGNGTVTHFHDFVLVNNNTGAPLPGEVWEISALNSGSIFESDGVTPIAVGTALTDLGGGIFRIDLWHPAGVGFDVDVTRTAGGSATTLNTGGVCAACQQIPTLGQWGLILLSLLILTFGVVALRSRETVLAGAGGVSFPTSNRTLPFNKAAFGKMLIVVMVGLAAVFAVAVSAFGYEMTAADVPGSLVAGPMLAYLLHVVFEKK